MKIDLQEIPRLTGTAFSEKYNLTMVVKERCPDTIARYHLSRFYAHFEGVEVRDGIFLVSTSGEGDTPETAIADYIGLISGKPLSIRAYTPDRIDLDPTHLSGAPRVEADA